MSNKLTFEEWKRRLQDECYNSDCTTDCAGCKFSVDKLSAWNFAQAQEQKEVEELKKKVEELEIYKKQNDVDLNFMESLAGNFLELQKENESLKKKLEACQECDYDNCKNCKLFEGEWG